MGVLTMDMSGYKVEHGDMSVPEYGDEVLCAGWIPSLALRESHREHVEMPISLAMMDADAFLRKMYACQR